jgi:hypothetical protein
MAFRKDCLIFERFGMSHSADASDRDHWLSLDPFICCNSVLESRPKNEDFALIKGK